MNWYWVFAVVLIMQLLWQLHYIIWCACFACVQIVQCPKTKYRIHPPELTRPSPYPVALVHGQYAEYYHKYVSHILTSISCINIRKNQSNISEMYIWQGIINELCSWCQPMLLVFCCVIDVQSQILFKQCKASANERNAFVSLCVSDMCLLRVFCVISCCYYCRYTPDELKYLPVRTALYNPPVFIDNPYRPLASDNAPLSPSSPVVVYT